VKTKPPPSASTPTDPTDPRRLTDARDAPRPSPSHAGIVLTNDGNAILREIDVTHPAAKVRVPGARIARRAQTTDRPFLSSRARRRSKPKEIDRSIDRSKEFVRSFVRSIVFSRPHAHHR
jgi:hypothetical protein